jgi:hypothetical protein
MGVVRTGIGALLGAVAAGTALRLRRASRERGVPMAELLPELPQLVANDAQWLTEVAKDAARDGLRAAKAQEAALDKVLDVPRQTKEPS